MAEDKQALIHRVVESVYNEGDLDVVDELYAPSVRINGKAAARLSDRARTCNDGPPLAPGIVVALGRVLIGD